MTTKTTTSDSIKDMVHDLSHYASMSNSEEADYWAALANYAEMGHAMPASIRRLIEAHVRATLKFIRANYEIVEHTHTTAFKRLEWIES